MATRTPFTGCGTALVTPFTADGALVAARWVRGRRGWFTMRDVLEV